MFAAHLTLKTGAMTMITTLPRPKTAMIRRIEAYLDEKYPSNRPRELAPAVLATLVELHLRGVPYPGRHAMAAHLNSTKDSIDAVINTAKTRPTGRSGERMISIEVRLVEGDAARRESTRQEKHLIPSRELLSAATEG